MNRKEIILAGLASGGGALHSPVQVQKLFFLIDRNIPKYINGPQFNFQPYNYGPFDRAIYDVLDELTKEGLVEVIANNRWREYGLTDTGLSLGNSLLQQLPLEAREYITRVSEFVRKLSFTQLVSTIYKAYPEMKANSVFQE